MKKLLLFSSVVILVFMAAPALAVPHTDSFDATINGPTNVTGGGTGYDGGTWYYYPIPDTDTGWWNQWFYDDKPDPFRWKEITYDIDIAEGGLILPDPPGYLTIVINWSTLFFPESGPDGLPPIPNLPGLDETSMINREHVVYQGPVAFDAMNFTETFIIPDYNPEWVSIDIMLSEGSLVDAPISVTGTIIHECIPAPGAILLGSIGVGLVGWLRKRRTI